MDYSNDACMNMFTAGQKGRVNYYLQLSKFQAASRIEIVDPANYASTGVNTNPSCGPIADFHTVDLETISCQGVGSIEFRDDSYNGEIVTRKWIFEGGSPSESSFENPAVQYDQPGVYKVTLIVSNGDGADTLVRENFITVFPAVAERVAPFGEDFEDNIEPAGWMFGGDEEYGWMIEDRRGYNSDQSAIAKIDNNTPNGTIFTLTMPPVDILSHGAPLNLTFRHAYRRRSTTVTEVMLIQVSENCGENWTTVKAMSATNGLASVDGFQANWVPTSASDWGYQVISLDKYASSRNLMVRFYVISKEGNSVFLDNINLGQFGLSAPDLALESSINFYPNPAEDQISVEFAKNSSALLEIKDVSGRSLQSHELRNGKQIISVADLTSGLYIIEVRFEGYIWTRKLIIN